MKRLDLTASIAVSGALVVHGVVLYVALEAEARGWGTGYHSGWPAEKRPPQMAIIEPAQATPPDNQQQSAVPIVPDFVMGEAGGTGESVNRDDDPTDQAGPKLTDMTQAWQAYEKAGDAAAADPRRRPEVPGDRGKNGQAEQAEPEFALPMRSLRTQAESTLTSREPYKKINAARVSPDSAEKNDVKGVGRDVSVPEERTAAPQTPDPKQSGQAADALDAKAGRPGEESAKANGHLVPESDRNADAAASKVAARFVRGHVIAQSGREVKFASPHRHLAATVDGWGGLAGRTIVLKISIDAAGNVRQAEVIKSCGAGSIDRAFVLAAYESWFEPAKGPDGKSTGDSFEFPIDLM